MQVALVPITQDKAAIQNWIQSNSPSVIHGMCSVDGGYVLILYS